MIPDRPVWVEPRRGAVGTAPGGVSGWSGRLNAGPLPLEWRERGQGNAFLPLPPMAADQDCPELVVPAGARTILRSRPGNRQARSIGRAERSTWGAREPDASGW